MTPAGFDRLLLRVGQEVYRPSAWFLLVWTDCHSGWGRRSITTVHDTCQPGQIVTEGEARGLSSQYMIPVSLDKLSLRVRKEVYHPSTWFLSAWTNCLSGWGRRAIIPVHDTCQPGQIVTQVQTGGLSSQYMIPVSLDRLLFRCRQEVYHSCA